MRPVTQPVRRKFTPQEDIALKYLIEELGTNNWQLIAKRMPNRNAKQCRDRYNNYLMEDHRSGPWTEMEDGVIWMKYNELGPKWVEISRFIPGRSGNDVKNRWYKHLARLPRTGQTFIRDDDHRPSAQIDPIEEAKRQYSVAALLSSRR